MLALGSGIADDEVPERPQALEAPLRNIPGDQCPVDGANRNPGHPVRGEASLGHARAPNILSRLRQLFLRQRLRDVAETYVWKPYPSSWP